MKQKEAVIKFLHGRGQRVTRIRREMIDILSAAKVPLSAEELGKGLEKKNLEANKTTVYRELSFLHENGIAGKVDFGDGVRRYEISVTHHHHVVCTQCKNVEDVILHHDVDTAAKRIAQEKGFQIFNHSLELFGLCANCR